MKPVSYQNTLPSVNGGHQNLDLDPVFSSKVMYCEKCGYPSTDAAMLEKHVSEHAGTPFYCFYCNNVSFSKAELNAHLQLHTSKYQFKCPHCGQGYVRRQCFVKHMERVHCKSSQGPAKPDMKIISPVPVSGALSSVSPPDPSSLRPAVQVTVPVPSTPAVRLKKDEQRGKMLDTNVSIVASGNPERVSPLNGLIQNNRALTVSLPEEVTIPAGCMVELVEVKTVNGTKELKLRLISQQENESVTKDTRTSVSQNAALGKPLSSTLNYQTSSVKTVNMGMCNINRKLCETKRVNVECPVVTSVSISKNPLNQEKSGFKRHSQELIKFGHSTVVPNKIQKTVLGAGREGNSGMRVTQGEPVRLNGAPSTVLSGRVAKWLSSTMHPDNMGESVSQRAVEEKKNSIPDHSKSVPPQKTRDTISIPREVSASVKWLEKTHPTSNTASKKFKDTLGLNHQRLNSAPLSSSAPLAAAIQVRPPPILAYMDNNVVNQSFPTHRILNDRPSAKNLVLSNHLNSKVSACKQEVRSSERAGDGDVTEPESFPIISSVFSLSQQPEESQGTIQPLVMALRGIVMDETCDSRPHEHIKMEKKVNEVPKTEFGAKTAQKYVTVNCDSSLTEHSVDSVKVEMHDKGVQQCPALMDHDVQVKVEKIVSMPADNKVTKCTLTPVSKSSTEQGSGSENTTQVDGTLATEAPQQVEKSNHDVSSRFLTVSLKRVQVGVWKKSSKGLKLRISRYKAHLPADSVADCAAIYPMPLKEDQLVKRPGPNQPVVVLNHPKPRAPLQGPRADAVADTGASAVVPKCQILKMRLSKVMGQKYEVMGCTVRVFP